MSDIITVDDIIGNKYTLYQQYTNVEKGLEFIIINYQKFDALNIMLYDLYFQSTRLTSHTTIDSGKLLRFKTIYIGEAITSLGTYTFNLSSTNDDYKIIQKGSKQIKL